MNQLEKEQMRIRYLVRKRDEEQRRLEAYHADRLRLYGACKWALSENISDEARVGISLAVRMKDQTDKALKGAKNESESD